MPFADRLEGRYDLVVVGSGFAASFFLAGYLPLAAAGARVAVLERGPRWDHARRVASRRLSPFAPDDLTRRTGDPHKEWLFTVAFGGGTNCWWANAPRFLPADFETRRRFGVGRDWPFGYDELAPYYERVETAMALAGPPPPWPYPRIAPYAQPPHRLNAPERLLQAAAPDSFFPIATGRARIATEARGACCANGVCQLCPVDAKWTVENGFMHVYENPRVSVLLDAEALAVETAAGRASGVRYRRGGREAVVTADLVALAANAVFNPVLLERSGLTHPLLGRRLHEQVGVIAEIHLDGLDSFQGSTSVTGHSYLHYADAARRREMAACLIETWNVGALRNDVGRWTQVLPVRLVYEALPEERNRIIVDPAAPARPVLHYEGHGPYTARAVARARADLERMAAPLPVERIVIREETERTEAHILGTTPMGDDPADSIVDAGSAHHRVRNLLVLGGSTFPVSGPANPSLTISALALRAAERVMT